MSRIAARVLSRTLTVDYGPLDDSFDRGWLDEMDDAGSGQVSVALDDADLSLVDFGRVVQFRLDGAAVFAALIETVERASVAQGEEAAQFAAIGGRGILAQWEDAVVYPEGGPGWSPTSEVRLFDFTSRYLDETAWTVPVVTPLETVGRPYPEGWPDPSAQWVWDRDSSVDGVPLGWVYFRKSFAVAADVNATLWVSADDQSEAFVDGVFIAGQEFVEGQSVAGSATLRLSAGTHVVAVRAKNLNELKATMALTIVGDDGATVLVRTDTSWLCLGYPPAPPGFTVGEVLILLLAEAQARSGAALPAWTTSFSASDDSDAVAWVADETFSFPVGRDMLTVLREVAERGHNVACSFASPLTLHAWRDGGRGSATAVAFDAAVDLTALTHSQEG